ncbi:MAG: NUDIX domain-containing protein [Planctomycetes bacterium]|nr:NUDIX domain-containing protein [Planctomycetota bacterium]
MPASHPHVEILARGLVALGDHLLLCRNVEAGYRYFPGGHVEFGEPAAEALRRELLEEAGVRWRVGPCLLVAENRFTQGGRERHEINLLFHVEHDLEFDSSTAPGVASLEPHIAFDWVGIHDVAAADARPAWLAALVRQHWATWKNAQSQLGCPLIWVSEGFSGASR